jgi:hypothetical protein
VVCVIGPKVQYQKSRMRLIPMRTCTTLTTVQKRGGNIKFPEWLLYAVSTICIIILSCGLSGPQCHPYIFRTIISRTILVLIGGLAGFIIVRFLTQDLSGCYSLLRRFSRILGYGIGAIWAAYHWEMILLYSKRIRSGYSDPILGKDIAFYLFDLPFYETLFMAVFCLITVSLACLFAGLFVRSDKGVSQQWMNRRGRLFQNQYDGIHISLGLLMFLMAWGRYLERYDQLYWQLSPDFNINAANSPVLLPSFGLIFVAMITGGFFLLFPFIRGRLSILPALQKLPAGRHCQVAPHFRLIRYVLAIAMVMMWHTAPQTTQPPVVQVSAAGLHLPFSEANQAGQKEYDPFICVCSRTVHPACLVNGFGSEAVRDSLEVSP